MVHTRFTRVWRLLARYFVPRDRAGWPLPGGCLAATWWLPGGYPVVTWRLLGVCPVVTGAYPVVTWRLPGGYSIGRGSDRWFLSFSAGQGDPDGCARENETGGDQFGLSGVKSEDIVLAVDPDLFYKKTLYSIENQVKSVPGMVSRLRKYQRVKKRIRQTIVS